jgi:hypothetical protein
MLSAPNRRPIPVRFLTEDAASRHGGSQERAKTSDRPRATPVDTSQHSAHGIRNGNRYARAAAIPLCRGDSFSDIPRNRAGRLAGQERPRHHCRAFRFPECAPCRPAGILINTEDHAHLSQVCGRPTAAHWRGISRSQSVGPGCGTARVPEHPILRAQSEARTKRRPTTAQCARGPAFAIQPGHRRRRLPALPQEAFRRRRGLDRAARHHLPLSAPNKGGSAPAGLAEASGSTQMSSTARRLERRARRDRRSRQQMLPKRIGPTSCRMSHITLGSWDCGRAHGRHFPTMKACRHVISRSLSVVACRSR